MVYTHDENKNKTKLGCFCIYKKISLLVKWSRYVLCCYITGMVYTHAEN